MTLRLFIVSILLVISTKFAYATNKGFDGYIIKYVDTASIVKHTNCLDKTKECMLLNSFNMQIVKELPERFDKDSNIEYVEPNWIYHTMYTPTDAEVGKQWAIKKIEAEKAWDLALGSKDVVVAVIDTGVDYTHPDLKNQMWVNELELNGKQGVDDDGNGYIDDIYGYDFANQDADPKDDHSHGTHCAGVIGAEHNSIGVAGINAHVKIMALKFLTASGGGTLADAVLSIKYAVDNGAQVLSNSWGGGGYSKAIEDAIVYARDKGVIFVAAAGNENNNNDTNPTYPASYQLDNIVTVAASDSNDSRAYFSNYGESVHIAAPGVNIYSTIKGGSYSNMSGTSMACPQVSGALALLLSYEDLTVAEMKERLLKTSDYLPAWEGLNLMAGRLNLHNLLTKHYPVRPAIPDDSLWVTHQASIASPHPYEDSKTYNYRLVVPAGAKFLRVHFSMFDTEAKYDKVTVDTGAKQLVYSGNKGAFYSGYLKVDNVKVLSITLSTDRSNVAEGFEIDHFQVQ